MARINSGVGFLVRAWVGQHQTLPHSLAHSTAPRRTVLPPPALDSKRKEKGRLWVPILIDLLLLVGWFIAQES